MLGGDGAPQIEAFSVHELSGALGWSQHATRALVSDVLNLAYRLPRVWALVLDGDLAPFRARNIAACTSDLTQAAAGFVDDQIAAVASRCSQADLDRLVETARARFMPQSAQDKLDASADKRHVTFDHGHVGFDGTSEITARLELADALDLDQRISDEAAELTRLGSHDSLDGRRATALGNLARADQTLPTNGPAAHDIETPDAASNVPVARRRQVVLNLHFPANVLTDPTTTGLLMEGGGRLVSAQQVRAWCGQQIDRITIRPVIDLNTTYASAGYAPSEKLRTQVELRDRTCVFPHCHRPAAACDLDHIEPHDPHGPPGQSTSSNLAPLCRAHHRAKTHRGRHGIWAYRRVAPATYLWTSPLGQTYLRDPVGTINLTSPPQPTRHPMDDQVC